MSTKVLHIIESLEFGGAEMVVINLANKLCEKYDIHICMTKREGDLCKRVDSRVKLHSLSCAEGNDLSAIYKIKDIIRDNKIDIIHVHNWSVFVESVIAAKLAGACKIIHTIHGLYASHDKNLMAALKWKLRHLVENILSVFVTQFIPVSYSIQEYIEQDFHINKKKIKPIHNAIAGLEFNNVEKITSNELRLVTVGRVAKVKNHRLMLNAIRKALDSGAVVSLTVVGDGPEYQDICDYSKSLKLDKYVEFLGFRSDIANIISNKDAFILTSDYEGISIALLESMSIGLPAIATSVGGIPETIIHNKTGLLVDQGDVKGLADAIILMAAKPELRAQFGHQAYEYFMREFEENNFIKKYDKAYAS